MIASCVALSPGAPAHVLLDDEVAEHIPGCNMAFRREALEAISGFDPIFRAAGDDVDVCWRLQNKGYKIGFSPAALVWHFRRNTVRDYLSQQRGYGKAETLLFFKHPSRFNVLGQSRWFGRIYGDLSSFLSSRQPRIYSGSFRPWTFSNALPAAALRPSMPADDSRVELAFSRAGGMRVYFWRLVLACTRAIRRHSSALPGKRATSSRPPGLPGRAGDSADNISYLRGATLSNPRALSLAHSQATRGQTG